MLDSLDVGLSIVANHFGGKRQSHSVPPFLYLVLVASNLCKFARPLVNDQQRCDRVKANLKPLPSLLEADN